MKPAALSGVGGKNVVVAGGSRPARDELPTTAKGKILRREPRGAVSA